MRYVLRKFEAESTDDDQLWVVLDLEHKDHPVISRHATRNAARVAARLSNSGNENAKT